LAQGPSPAHSARQEQRWHSREHHGARRRNRIRILLAGYAPPNNGFSLSLKRIGERVQAKFGKDVDVKYLYNILDLGYKGEDLPWLVEDGVLTMAYQSSSYFTGQIPDLGIADLPFLFSDTTTARAAMDGRFGATLAQRMETKGNYRILGWFENGFRHISNRLRPIHTPADMKGMTIRVLPSKVQERTFALLGATPRVMDLSELLPAIKAGTLDAQENPVLEHHHLRRAQVPQVPHRVEPLLSLAADLLQQDRLRRVAEGTAGRNARGGEGRRRLPAATARQGRRRCDGGDPEGRWRDRRASPEEHQKFADAVKPIYGEAAASTTASFCR
jgi:hypothetical protein